MKNFILAIIAVFAFSTMNAQDLKVSTKIKGVNVSSKLFDLDKKKEKAPATFESLSKNATITEHKATYKGKEYDVYESKTGKYFIITTSSKGNFYRKYIKEE